MVEPDSTPREIANTIEVSYYERRLEEACSILRTSDSVEDILLVLYSFPFQDSHIPFNELMKRCVYKLDEILKCLPTIEDDLKDDHDNDLNRDSDPYALKLLKVQEILRRTETYTPSFHNWNWKWSPLVPSSTVLPFQVANDMVKQMSEAFSKLHFMALVREGYGLQPGDVKDVKDGIVHTRSEICRRFKELHIPTTEYAGVETHLEPWCPIAYWTVSTSIRSTDASLDPSNALAFILVPMRKLFEDPKLPVIPMLRRQNILGALHQDILNRLDENWDGLLSANFSFLEDVQHYTPRELAVKLTDEDYDDYWNFLLALYLSPAKGVLLELRNKVTKWGSLKKAVKTCAIACPDLVGRISKTAKDLLDGKNLCSGTAFLQGLCDAKQYPAELSKYWWLLDARSNCIAYRKYWGTIHALANPIPHEILLQSEAASEKHKGKIHADLCRFLGYPGLLSCIEETNLAEAKAKSEQSCIGTISTLPVAGAKAKRDRSCTGALHSIISTLPVAILFGRFLGRRHADELPSSPEVRSPENTGGSSSESSTQTNDDKRMKSQEAAWGSLSESSTEVGDDSEMKPEKMLEMKLMKEVDDVKQMQPSDENSKEVDRVGEKRERDLDAEVQKVSRASHFRLFPAGPQVTKEVDNDKVNEAHSIGNPRVGGPSSSREVDDGKEGKEMQPRELFLHRIRLPGKQLEVDSDEDDKEVVKNFKENSDWVRNVIEDKKRRENDLRAEYQEAWTNRRLLLPIV